jgi:uncharacterized membrane protein
MRLKALVMAVRAALEQQRRNRLLQRKALLYGFAATYRKDMK